MAWSLLGPRLLTSLSLILYLLRLVSAEPNQHLAQERPPPPESDECWIFMHLQKCGGSTVKQILSETWGHRWVLYRGRHDVLGCPGAEHLPQ